MHFFIFFCSKIIFDYFFLLFTEINLTTRGPLYTCLVAMTLTSHLLGIWNVLNGQKSPWYSQNDEVWYLMRYTSVSPFMRKEHLTLDILTNFLPCFSPWQIGVCQIKFIAPQKLSTGILSNCNWRTFNFSSICTCWVSS